MAYPSLIITYLGQAAFLMVNPDSYSTTFYASIPSPVFWPMFVVAVLAAIVASQVSHHVHLPLLGFGGVYLGFSVIRNPKHWGPQPTCKESLQQFSSSVVRFSSVCTPKVLFAL